MEGLNINELLNRQEKADYIKELLIDFEKNKNNVLFKKGIYVYGDPGTGKTTFVMGILKSMNYDVIKYDAGDIRNTSVIEDITKHNMSDTNIMSLFNKKVKELMKVCNIVELKTPNSLEISKIIKYIIPEIKDDIECKIIDFVQGDLRKLNNIYNILKNNPDLFNDDIIENIFHTKSYNDDTKKITKKLINNYYQLNNHLNIMNETDRTSVGLLWHENIIDVIDKIDKSISIPFYINQLENICLADYIDRITFQQQIWQFNEMSSLIKTFKNNKLYHETFKTKQPYNPSEVRFTKVLTKYSTEYNNSLFIQKLCQKLGMDKKDLIGFFIDLKSKYSDNDILPIFENYEITKLDINRIYRYLEKYTKENAEGTQDKDVEIEDEEEISEE